MKKQILFLNILLTLLCGHKSFAQVTIGDDKFSAGALLQLNQNGAISNKGLGMPRVLLEGIDTLSPCVAGLTDENLKQSHKGLIVFNIKDDISLNLCKGLYVWDGVNWNKLGEGCPMVKGSITIIPEQIIVPWDGTRTTFTLNSTDSWNLSVENEDQLKEKPLNSGEKGETLIYALNKWNYESAPKEVLVKVKSSLNPALKVEAKIIQEGKCLNFSIDNYEIFCPDFRADFENAKKICESIIPLENPENKFVLLTHQSTMLSGIYGGAYNTFQNAQAYWVGDQPTQAGGQERIVTYSYTGGNMSLSMSSMIPSSQNLVRCIRQK